MACDVETTSNGTDIDAMAHKVILGYEFDEPVGTWGFGIVYRASLQTLRRTVACSGLKPVRHKAV